MKIQTTIFVVLCLALAACRSEDPEGVGTVSAPAAHQSALAKPIPPAPAPPNAPAPPAPKPLPPINGICGTANNTSIRGAPSGPSLCKSGTPSAVTGSGPFLWTCSAGNITGISNSCSASLAAPPVVVVWPAANQHGAVAFEDRLPSLNDEDFNDFLTDLQISILKNSLNQIVEMVIDFYPRAVGAAFDHSFLLVINGHKQNPVKVKHPDLPPLIVGEPKVTLTYYGPMGEDATSGPTAVPYNKDVVIFPSTHEIFGKSATDSMPVNTEPKLGYVPALKRARVHIFVSEKDQPNNPVPIDPKTGKLDLSKLRVMLHVKPYTYRKNGRFVTDSSEVHDIDVIDVDPSNFDVNPKDGKEYPFGFFIPDTWKWTNEGTPLVEAYSAFADYRDYLKNLLSNPSLQQTGPEWFTQTPPPSLVYENLGNPIPPLQELPNPWPNSSTQ